MATMLSWTRVDDGETFRLERVAVNLGSEKVTNEELKIKYTTMVRYITVLMQFYMVRN